jgi:EmrB/QacA subfamily drug resistance transporter
VDPTPLSGASGSEGAAPGAVRFASVTGRWVLAVTILGSAIGFLDATVVNVALPQIGAELDADVAGLQWIINGYGLTLAALILLGGSFSDRFGRRRIFNLGVAWFTTASVLCAVAPDSGVLVAARALQGVGAAFVTPGSLAIIESTFRRGDRARAIGAWSALSGVAAAVGPLVGGYLVDAVSWRAIFLLNVPIGVFVMLAASRHVPESRDETVTGRLDYLGSALATIALAGLTYALIEAPVQGLASPIVLGALAAGLLTGTGFVLRERRVSNPMLPLSIFSSRQFASANLVTLVVYAALGGVFFLLVVFLQTSLGYSPVAAGAAALPVTVLMLLLSARSGALAERIGPRIPLTIGPLLLGTGMFLMTTIDPGDTYVAGVLPPVAVFGLGLATTVAPVTATALAAADERHSGVASGVNNAVSRFAGLLAVAALPVIAGLSGGDFQDPAAFADGFRTAMLVTAGLAVLGAALAFLTIRNDVLELEPAGAADIERRPRDDRWHASHCAVSGAPLRVHCDAA